MPLPLRSQSTRRLLAWVLAVLIGTGIVLPVIPDPQIDLAVYLRGGQEALSGSDSLYTASESWPLPFTYPPFAALLFAPWSLIPPLILRVGLVLLSTAALARTLLLILRALEREGYALRIPAVGAVFAVLCALFAEPVLTTLRLGQVNLILGWMIVEDLLPRRRYGRGILVGLAAAIKLTPAVFGLILLLRRDWRGLAGAITAGMLATGIGYFALPHSTWDFLTRAVRDPARVGGVAYSSNQSLNGALWRATSPGGAPALWLVGVLILLVAATWLIIQLLRAGLDAGAVLVNALLGLLISPISWSHHWCWLVGWVITLWAYAQQDEQQRWNTGRSMAVIVTLPVLTWMVYWMPSGEDQEYGVHWLGKIITDAYLIVTLISTAWLATWVRRQPRHTSAAH